MKACPWLIFQRTHPGPPSFPVPDPDGAGSPSETSWEDGLDTSCGVCLASWILICVCVCWREVRGRERPVYHCVFKGEVLITGMTRGCCSLYPVVSTKDSTWDKYSKLKCFPLFNTVELSKTGEMNAGINIQINYNNFKYVLLKCCFTDIS